MHPIVHARKRSQQNHLFSYLSPDQREDHPLRDPGHGGLSPEATLAPVRHDVREGVASPVDPCRATAVRGAFADVLQRRIRQREDVAVELAQHSKTWQVQEENVHSIPFFGGLPVIRQGQIVHD